MQQKVQQPSETGESQKKQVLLDTVPSKVKPPSLTVPTLPEIEVDRISDTRSEIMEEKPRIKLHMRKAVSSKAVSGSESSSEENSPRKWRSYAASGHKKLDCGATVGCHSEEVTTKFELSVKPKDPPSFSGKQSDDVEVWIRQVDNFLSLIGGSDRMQVAYMVNLLQHTA